MSERVAVYYRVSTDRQDLHIQREAVERWLAERSPPPRKVYTLKDEGYSGNNPRRPAYRELMRLVTARKIDVIVVYKLDRFSRSASTAIRTLLALDDYDVGFVSVTQPIISLEQDNPFRRTMLAAFAEISQIERETIVARVHAGLQAAKARGVKLGRPSKTNADTVYLAKQLRQSGLSYAKIAHHLNLSKGKVHNMLKD